MQQRSELTFSRKSYMRRAERKPAAGSALCVHSQVMFHSDSEDTICMSRTISISPVTIESEAHRAIIETKLVDLFIFHGKISRVAIVCSTGCAFVEFERADATASALMFDGSRFNGVPICVKVIDSLPESIEESWSSRRPGEHTPLRAAPASPKATLSKTPQPSRVASSKAPSSRHTAAEQPAVPISHTAMAARHMPSSFLGDSLVSFLGLTLFFQLTLILLSW